MLYRISVTERGLTGIDNIFRSRLSRFDDLLGAGTVPLTRAPLGGLFRAPPPPIAFLRYLLNQCRYHHQTCSTLSPNIFTHCVKILKSRVS